MLIMATLKSFSEKCKIWSISQAVLSTKSPIILLSYSSKMKAQKTLLDKQELREVVASTLLTINTNRSPFKFKEKKRAPINVIVSLQKTV